MEAKYAQGLSTLGAVLIIIVLAILVWVGIIIFDQGPSVQDNTIPININPLPGDVSQDQLDEELMNETSGNDISPIDDAQVDVISEENISDTKDENKTVTVTYTASGFSPTSVTVSQGDTIRFVNESQNLMWAASNRHPTHTTYPDSDIKKCGESPPTPIFDQCKGGASFSFTFNEVGSWNYHNHLLPRDGGVIVVE